MIGLSPDSHSQDIYEIPDAEWKDISDPFQLTGVVKYIQKLKIEDDTKETTWVGVNQRDVGKLIGKGGETIRYLKEQGNVTISITEEQLRKNFTLVVIKGRIENREWCLNQIRSLSPTSFSEYHTKD